MNFAFLASCLLFCAVIYHAINRSKSIEENSTKAFWQKEQQANFVRKKSLDNLDYITIPEQILHLSPQSSSEKITYVEYMSTLVRNIIVTFNMI